MLEYCQLDPGNKLQWNFNRNSNICIEENTFENVVSEMLFISSRPQSNCRSIKIALLNCRILKIAITRFLQLLKLCFARNIGCDNLWVVIYHGVSKHFQAMKRSKLFTRISVTISTSIPHITGTSCERHGVLDHRIIDCLFNSFLFSITATNHKSSDLLAYPIMRGIRRGGFPS